MLRSLIVVVLVTVASPEGASSSRVKRIVPQTLVLLNNTIIELLHNCTCVQNYQCDENNNIITDGGGIFKRRMARSVNRIMCDGSKFHYHMVCCKHNNTNSTLAPSVRSPSNGIPIKPNDKIGTCGRQQTLIQERGYVDKSSPVEGDFGWIAAIFNKTTYGSYMFHCSGSLIHPKVVLTASHCVHRYRKHPSNFIVAVNGKTKLSIEDVAQKEKRNVVEIVKHPMYATSGRLTYDFALLILEKPFPVAQINFINTLCLPQRQINSQDTDCLVVGWEESGNQGRLNLKSVEVPFINRDQCQNRLRETRLGEDFDLDKSFLCAEQNWKDDYRRDSGSPLMCPTSLHGEQYFQAGIVSWGDECGLEGTPGVYANVFEVVDWIKDELRARELEI